MVDVRDPTLADVEAIAGPAAAQRLAEDFGGKRLYLPRTPGETHPISASVGHAAARALGAKLGGFHLDVPVSPSRRAEILRLRDQGLGPIAIQRRMKCSRRLVFKVLEQARKPESQMSLPL